MYARVMENQWNYNLGDLEGIAESAEDLEKLVTKKKNELETLQNKLEYLEETGKEEVDFEEFKSYQVLKVLSDADLNLVQKSEKIASVFKVKR
jgi:tRNA(Ser,Leu) C12 N-acetylase TAN1